MGLGVTLLGHCDAVFASDKVSREFNDCKMR